MFFYGSVRFWLCSQWTWIQRSVFNLDVDLWWDSHALENLNLDLESWGEKSADSIPKWTHQKPWGCQIQLLLSSSRLFSLKGVDGTHFLLSWTFFSNHQCLPLIQCLPDINIFKSFLIPARHAPLWRSLRRRSVARQATSQQRLWRHILKQHQNCLQFVRPQNTNYESAQSCKSQKCPISDRASLLIRHLRPLVFFLSMKVPPPHPPPHNVTVGYLAVAFQLVCFRNFTFKKKGVKFFFWWF